MKLHNPARKDLEADGELRDINRCRVIFLSKVHPDSIKKNDCSTQSIHFNTVLWASRLEAFVLNDLLQSFDWPIKTRAIITKMSSRREADGWCSPAIMSKC